jgi:hypothetical protein
VQRIDQFRFFGSIHRSSPLIMGTTYLVLFPVARRMVHDCAIPWPAHSSSEKFRSPRLNRILSLTLSNALERDPYRLGQVEAEASSPPDYSDEIQINRTGLNSLCRINYNARTHGGTDSDLFDENTFCTAWAGFVNRIDKCSSVFF